MKIAAMGLDDNGRSITTFIDIPLKKVSETKSISARQDGVEWRIGFREVTDVARTEKNFLGPFGGGPTEMHVGGPPHFVGVMSGHIESTMQDGSIMRLNTGEFQFVRPGALHNSTLVSNTTLTMFNLLLPGTAADTQEYKFK
jgi:mannose-6-phosphate isomerase-like protein (cupin superfamily)